MWSLWRGKYIDTGCSITLQIFFQLQRGNQAEITLRIIKMKHIHINFQSSNIFKGKKGSRIFNPPEKFNNQNQFDP